MTNTMSQNIGVSQSIAPSEGKMVKDLKKSIFKSDYGASFQSSGGGSKPRKKKKQDSDDDDMSSSMYSGTDSATLSKSVEKKFANLMKNKALLNAG